MTKLNAIYVPDELFAQLGQPGGVDHFEYDVPGAGYSTAVFVDGRREQFDSEVTPERIAEASAKNPPSGHVIARVQMMQMQREVRKFCGAITGWTK